MLSFGTGIRIFVGVEPVDMRGSFDSLAGAARRLGLEPTDAHNARLAAEVARLSMLVAETNDRLTELMAAMQRKQGGGQRRPKAPEAPPGLDEAARKAYDVVAEHQRRRVVRRKTCTCRHCGTRTTPRSLPSPFPRSKATCEWLAWFIHQRFVMLTPLDRLHRDLEAKGLPLAMSYMVAQVERAADLLGPVDGEHWKQLLAGEWMGHRRDRAQGPGA